MASKYYLVIAHSFFPEIVKVESEVQVDKLSTFLEKELNIKITHLILLSGQYSEIRNTLPQYRIKDYTSIYIG